MLKRILCVDDEPNILRAFERQFRKQFEIHTAPGPEIGLRDLAACGPFAVVVSDLRMPGMDGVQFLERVRQRSPDTVRVMLTGQADLNAAIAAVNQGNIFQFLTKPCPGDMLTRALEAAVEQHRLITAERELLEKTLSGSIEVLSEILSLVNPPAFSRAHRIRRYVQHMAARLDLPDQWQYGMAAMLSQIGCVTVPPDVLEKIYAAEPLNEQEDEIFASHCAVGYNLLARIPRLETIARMVGAQRNAGGAMPPAGAKDRLVTLGGQMLRIALDFDEQIIRGRPLKTVVAEMRHRREYNDEFLPVLEELEVEQASKEVRAVKIHELRTGMAVNADVHTRHGVLLLAKGQEITEPVLARLKSFTKTVGVVEPISVVIQRAMQTVG